MPRWSLRVALARALPVVVMCRVPAFAAFAQPSAPAATAGVVSARLELWAAYYNGTLTFEPVASDCRATATGAAPGRST